MSTFHWEPNEMGFGPLEALAESVHNRLCPGNDKHVPGECQPTTEIMDLFIGYMVFKGVDYLDVPQEDPCTCNTGINCAIHAIPYY